MARALAIHTFGENDDRKVGGRSYVSRSAKSIRGCIFCLTGREQAVVERIQCACSEVRATAAMQEKYKSDNGKKSKVQTVVLPGYVFFEAPDDVSIIMRLPRKDILRILMGNDQDWRAVIMNLAGLVNLRKV